MFEGLKACHIQWRMLITFTWFIEQELWEESPTQVVIVERGCAQQSYQHQALVRGKWRTVTTVMEEVLRHNMQYSHESNHNPDLINCLQVYTSGCLTDREWAGPLSSDTEYCYCKGDKCNDQKQVQLSKWNDCSWQYNQQQGGDLKASNGTDSNSTSTATSSQSYSEPDSLPHPRDTRLFYETMRRSGSLDSIPMVGLLVISCIFARLLP